MNKAPVHAKFIKNFPIETDFRTSIRYELLMTNPNISDEEKLREALRLYFPRNTIYPSTVRRAVDSILWFYTCGKDEDEIVEATGKKDSKVKPSGMNRVYDYEYDADYIYAAFFQQYGVDLQKEYLHWWKFRAMFKALTEQCEFVKIMGYRSIKINNNMTKSQKEFYTEMKRIHALPIPKSERQKIKAIEDALLNGGDLSAVLGMYATG